MNIPEKLCLEKENLRIYKSIKDHFEKTTFLLRLDFS